MAMHAPTPVMTGLTWQEFLDLPEEYRHASLIDGELYVTRPAFGHQVVVARLLYYLTAWIEGGPARGVAAPEPAVRITDDRGYMPDVAWWCEDKYAPTDGTPAVDGPPDIVAEVLSPSTQRIDAIRKRNDYPTVGVSELWLVDPHTPSAQVIRFGATQETVLELDAGDVLTSPLLPGFSVTLRELVDRRSSRQRPR
jgi:Uma2 family endonuclease